MNSSEHDEQPIGEIKYLYTHKRKLFYLIAVLLAAAILVTVISVTAKKDYKLYVFYAGPENISSKSIHSEMIAGLTEKTGSLDPDLIALNGSVYVNSTLAKEYTDNDIYFSGLTNSDTKTELTNIIVNGEYRILLLDRELYESYEKERFFSQISDLTDIDPAGKIDDYAVLISGSSLKNIRGFKDLPDDTVIVFTKNSYVQTLFKSAKKVDREFNEQKDYFVSLIR